MKKILLVFPVLFVSCFEVQVKPREVNAQSFHTSLSSFNYTEETRSGMVYGIWYVPDRTSQTGYGIYVVNLTKDALEVELLRKQLKSK